MQVNHTLYNGKVNKELRINYQYNFEESGKFQTIVQKEGSNTIYIRPSYALTISLGYQKGYKFIPSFKYYGFRMLLQKTIKSISENLYILFPDISQLEFEIDAKALQRFQTEKAMSKDGMTMIPCVYVDDCQQCYPAIRLSDESESSLVIPFEDAITISDILYNIEPNTFGLSILRILGKID